MYLLACHSCSPAKRVYYSCSGVCWSPRFQDCPLPLLLPHLRSCQLGTRERWSTQLQEGLWKWGKAGMELQCDAALHTKFQPAPINNLVFLRCSSSQGYLSLTPIRWAPAHTNTAVLKLQWGLAGSFYVSHLSHGPLSPCIQQCM